MRGLEPKHYFLLAGFLTSLAVQIGGLQHGWHDATSPQFISGLIAEIATLLGALYAGAPGATGQMKPEPLDAATSIKDPSRFGQAGPPAILLALALAGGMFMPACAATKIPATITTPAGQAAYQAKEVIDRLSEISDLVAGDIGNFPGGIKPADAFTILEWISGDAHGTPPTTGIAQLVAGAGSGQGWKATAKASWQARVRPLVLKYPSLASWVGIVDSMLEVF